MVNTAIVCCNGKMGCFVAQAVQSREDCNVLFGVDAFAEEYMHKLKIVEVKLLCLCKVIVKTKLTDVMHFLGADVCEYRDNTESAE